MTALIVELGGAPLDPKRAAETYARLCADPDLGFVVLGSDSVCTVSFAHALRANGRYAIIQEMYVTPELRGTGIGRETLALALVTARERGCPFAVLGTRFQGERQIAFYARSGFVNLGARLR